MDISAPTFLPSPSVVLLDFVLLFEHLLALCAKFGSVTLMSALLYIVHFRKGKLRVNSFSPCMHLFLVAHIFCSVLGIPYVFYMLFWALPHIWSGLHDSPYYSPYVLFWTGILEISYITAAPCLVTLLTLERCIILKSTNLHRLWLRNALFCIGTLIFIALWANTLIFYLLQELPLQLNKVSDCKTTSCETIQTLSIHSVGPKVVMGLINVFCCFVFLLLLRTAGPINLKNRVVKLSIFTEIFLNALPALGALLFNWTTGLVMANYVGELSISACPVDAFICAVIYWRTFVKCGAVAHQQTLKNAIATVKPMPTTDRRTDRRQTIR